MFLPLSANGWGILCTFFPSTYSSKVITTYINVSYCFTYTTTTVDTLYFLLCNKKSWCDFDDKLKDGDVRYKHLTQITIKVQLFWRLPYEM